MRTRCYILKFVIPWTMMTYIFRRPFCGVKGRPAKLGINMAQLVFLVLQGPGDLSKSEVYDFVLYDFPQNKLLPASDVQRL